VSAARSSEAHFQRQVLQLAGFYGWLAYHTHDSRRSQPGFPDLVLVRGPELIFAELKTDAGRLKRAQEEWVAALERVSSAIRGAGLTVDVSPDVMPVIPAVDVYVWRPADFDDLHARLARGRRRQTASYEFAA
jgi:hypothetical protein